MTALENIPNIKLLALNVTKDEDITAVLDVVEKEGLDVLVNNAALGLYAPILDTNVEVGRETFEANL